MPKDLHMKLWFPSIDHVTNEPVGVPSIVSAQVAVENTEHEIRWSSDRQPALEVIGGRPCGHHRYEKDQDTRNTDENLHEH
jgi:hypothetical protein